MPRPGDRERLQHILEAIDRIGEYIEGMDAVDYYGDIRTRDAVERRVDSAPLFFTRVAALLSLTQST